MSYSSYSTALTLLLTLACSVGCATAPASSTQVTPRVPSALARTGVPSQSSAAADDSARKTGNDSYTVTRLETLTNVARHQLPRTSYMAVAELESALRRENSIPAKQFWLKPGTTLTIPGVEAQPVVEHPRHDPADMEIRAIYLTGSTAGSALGLKIIEHWKQVGGNAIVFDVKDSDGLLSIPFDNPLAPHNHPAISNLPKFVRWLHQHDLHAIARIALFRDEHIARDFPRLAVQSRSNPAAPWRENGKLVWTDTSNPEVQSYNIALAKYVATSGVDEVQFDYVRFPAEGDQHDARFAFQSAHPAWQRADVIADFLDRAYGQIHPLNVLVSLDVFGVMAWQRSVDLSHTGQDIVRMSQHADVLSPMIYPSHFFNMDGYTGKDGHALPGDAPEHFISTSMDRFHLITTPSNIVIRPWLQAFAWRTHTYSPAYVMDQIKTSKAHSGVGFLLWNARNDYSKPYIAMTSMAQSPAQYFATTALPAKHPPSPVAAAN